jgi:hypothetical protein
MISKQLETNEKQGIQSAFHTAALLPRERPRGISTPLNAGDL